MSAKERAEHQKKAIVEGRTPAETGEPSSSGTHTPSAQSSRSKTGSWNIVFAFIAVVAFAGLVVQTIRLQETQFEAVDHCFAHWTADRNFEWSVEKNLVVNDLIKEAVDRGYAEMLLCNDGRQGFRWKDRPTGK